MYYFKMCHFNFIAFPQGAPIACAGVCGWVVPGIVQSEWNHSSHTGKWFHFTSPINRIYTHTHTLARVHINDYSHVQMLIAH